MAPGSIAAVFGNFPLLAPISSTTLPISTNLSGLALRFSGSMLAPLFYASLTQVNFQVPWELAGQSQSTITASLSAQTSVSQTLTLAPYAPGIFTLDNGQGAILDSSYQVVNGTNPAPAGSYVQIYCTGLGAVTNQPATGAAAPSNPLAETTATPVVTIGGSPALVLYSGLVPGTVGEYQINAQVPVGSVKGATVPVVISIGGVSSNSVTMGVQ